MKTYYYALLASCIWGIAPILEKIGLGKTEPEAALLIRCLGVISGAFLLIIFRNHTLRSALQSDAKTFTFLLLGGLLASFLGQIFFYRALKSGATSQIVPLAATYPLVSFLIGVIFLSEQITLAKTVGVLLVITGIFFLK
jgi:transporter family protein